MRLHVVFRYVGFVLLLNAFFLLVSAGVSLIHEDNAFFPLLFTSLVASLFGLFPLVFVPATDEISNMESLVIVVASWLLSCLVGMLPYVIWGGEFTVTNAWFESVSGYTTTGASILNNIEILPKGLLFWRSSTHWVGGIGIIIFMLSVLPSMGFASTMLYKTEMSPAALRQFKMRSKEAIQMIVKIYLGITLLETIALFFCGMDLFDAVTHSFATVATGGFSTRNASIAAFDNLSIEIVIMFFMIVSGVNFALIFALIVGQFKEIIYSSVIKYYLLINFSAIFFVSLNISSDFNTYWDALRYASFQILSVGTSTGFANADSSIWPVFSQFVIIFFTLQCACAGSTSGGIKADRVVLLFKAINRHIRQLRHPNAVLPIKLDRKNVSNETIEGALLYILFYICIVFVSGMILSLMNVDALSAFSGSAAMMGNVGPGLSTVGSLENYSAIPLIGKWVLSITMLLGRLEIYGLIIFLIPKTWK